MPGKKNIPISCSYSVPILSDQNILVLAMIFPVIMADFHFDGIQFNVSLSWIQVIILVIPNCTKGF